MSYRIDKKVPTRLNPFTGVSEPVAVHQRLDWLPRVIMGQQAIMGLRKRRTTPGAPWPFSYGWEKVYKKVES